MSKKKLILVPSPAMDSNKKKDRTEGALLRMSAKARESLAIDESTVNVFSEKDAAVNLEIFKAFSDDIKRINNMGFSEADKGRIAFVTTETYRKLTAGTEPHKSVWLSKDIESVVFGTDPEFLIYKDNEIVPANILLNHHGPMGSDGAMGEVRPAPARTPEELVKNITNIFKAKEYKNIIDNYTLKAGCYIKTDQRDYPIGGHIHIGNPAQILKVASNQRDYMFRTMNRIMDELISIPLMRLDGKEQGKSRRVGCKMASRGGYGFFGEYRTAGEGNSLRLEHRTLSGMWLLHPSVAVATLGTAKAIIDEMWSLIGDKKFNLNYVFPEEYQKQNVWKGDFNGWRNIPLCRDLGCTDSSGEIITQLHESNPENINKAYLDIWIARMRGLSSYKQHQEHINLLYEILKIKLEELRAYDNTLQKNWLNNTKFITH